MPLLDLERRVVASGNLNENDAQAVELGVRFRSDSDGFITALRFYRSPVEQRAAYRASVDQRQARCWPAQPSRASAHRAGRRWRSTRRFAVTAGASYIASYHTQNYYAFAGGYFTAAVDNPPLRALADGDGRRERRLRVRRGGHLSRRTPINRASYWVDVVFETAVGPDTDPPGVSASLPANGATNVPVGTQRLRDLRRGDRPQTLDGTRFALREGASPPVPASIELQRRDAHRDARARRGARRHDGSTPRELAGGAGGIADLAGNALPADVTGRSRRPTRRLRRPTRGPAARSWSISSTANPFGRYFAEILRTEGLNSFR